MDQEKPKKHFFPEEKQQELLKEAEKIVRERFLPDDEVNEIILFGSLVKGEFGRYETDYRGRKFSDIDILLKVSENYKPKPEWEVKDSHELYTVYRGEKIEGFEVDYVICPEEIYKGEENIAEGLEWGVPITEEVDAASRKLY